MVSIKKIMNRILVGISFFVVLALSINFFFLPATQSLINTGNEEVKAIKTQVMTMNLPIRVLENVLTQLATNPEKISNIKLIKAFDKNLIELQSLTEETSNKIVVVEKGLTKLNNYSFSFYQSTIKEMYGIIAQITETSNHLESVLSTSQISKTDIDAIKTYGINLDANINAFELAHQLLNEDILKAYTFAVNFIFVVMIIVLLSMSLGIYKIVTYDQAFVLESLKNIENKTFEFDQLPKTKLIFREEQNIYDRVKVIFDEEKFAQKIKSVILSTYHIEDLMQELFKEISLNKTIDRIGIAFVDYSQQKFIAEYGVASYDKMKLGPGFEVNFDNTSLTDILTTKTSFITKDLEAELQKRPQSDSLRLLRNEGIQSNLVVPLQMGEAVFGVIFFSSLKQDYFDASDMRRAEKIIYEISGLLNRAYFTKVILSKITNSFAELVDQKDNETGGHILRMVDYTVLIASRLMGKNINGYNVNEKFVLEIERNASAHDIGKVAIPDEILKKPGKLTPEEWVIMKTHASVGADIFKSLRESLQVFGSDFYGFAEVIARSHHERWDGKGYPDGLSGHAIPLAARIVAVADVFDALTSKRHYKERFGLEKAVEIMKESAGTHLDSVLVGVFLEHLDEIIEIQNLYQVD